jgi:hypothetical protein
VQVGIEIVVARHLVALAAFLVQPDSGSSPLHVDIVDTLIQRLKRDRID